MATITSRSYAGEADLVPIVELINACDAVDHLDEGISVEELQSRLSAPTIDLAHDVRLWTTGDGRLSGYGRLWRMEAAGKVDGFLDLVVHPTSRGNGLENEI